MTTTKNSYLTVRESLDKADDDLITEVKALLLKMRILLAVLSLEEQQDEAEFLSVDRISFELDFLFGKEFSISTIKKYLRNSSNVGNPGDMFIPEDYCLFRKNTLNEYTQNSEYHYKSKRGRDALRDILMQFPTIKELICPVPVKGKNKEEISQLCKDVLRLMNELDKIHAKLAKLL